MKIKNHYCITIDDSELWSNLKKGDEKAFSSLFEKYYAHLIRYGNSLSPFHEKVQDCVQDVFADIWLYRQRLSKCERLKQRTLKKSSLAPLIHVFYHLTGRICL